MRVLCSMPGLVNHKQPLVLVNEALLPSDNECVERQISSRFD